MIDECSHCAVFGSARMLLKAACEWRSVHLSATLPSPFLSTTSIPYTAAPAAAPSRYSNSLLSVLSPPYLSTPVCRMRPPCRRVCIRPRSGLSHHPSAGGNGHPSVRRKQRCGLCCADRRPYTPDVPCPKGCAASPQLPLCCAACPTRGCPTPPLCRQSPTPRRQPIRPYIRQPSGVPTILHRLWKQGATTGARAGPGLIR